MCWTAKFGDPAKSGVRPGSQKPSPAGGQAEARLKLENVPPACETASQALSGGVHTPSRLAISRFVPPVLSLQLPESNRQTLTNRFHIKPCAIRDLVFPNRQKPRRCLTQAARANPSRPTPKTALEPRTLRSKDLSYIAWNERSEGEIAEARIRRGAKASDIICFNTHDSERILCRKQQSCSNRSR